MAKGGALKPVYIVTDDELEINGGDFVLQQGPAMKVRGFTLANYAGRKVQSGAAQPVYVVPEASAPSLYGGHWRVIAGQPIKVLSVTNAERNIIQGPAIPVYPVDDDGNYDPNFGCSLPDIAGQIFWFEADAITGLNNGDNIPQWNDLSANAYHATQGVVANQPNYITNVINGLPVVRLNGTTDYFSITIPNYPISNWTLIVAQNHGGNQDRYLFDSATGRLIIAQSASVAPNTNIGFYDGLPGWKQIAPYTVGWQILSFVLDSVGGGNAYRNGAFIGTQVYVQIGIGGATVIFARNNGANYWYDGDIYAMLMYQGALSNENRRAVEQYLSCKTGITLV